MTKDLTQGKITPLLVKFTIPLLFGNIFQLMYNSVGQHYRRSACGKRGIGGGRHKQSINDTCNFVCERYVYRGFYFDGNPVRRKENGCFKAADQHDDDRRNCVLHCGHVVLHSFCQTVVITDPGAGGSASACSFLSENRVFGIYFYIYL